MALTISNESKNNVSITNDDKSSAGTWEDFAISWDEISSPWSAPGEPIVKETKNSITITNETK